MATKYLVDSLHSHVSFSVKHMMISNVKGKFNKFSGEFDFENNVFSSLKAVIDVNSIDTGEPKREEHLLSADFFDAGNFPNLTFVMTGYEAKGDEGTLTGDITIRGTTKSIKLKTEINGTINVDGKKHLGFSLNGKLSRKEFGLNWNGLIETGGVMVGDEIKLIIEIEAVQA